MIHILDRIPRSVDYYKPEISSQSERDRKREKDRERKGGRHREREKERGRGKRRVANTYTSSVTGQRGGRVRE